MSARSSRRPSYPSWCRWGSAGAWRSSSPARRAWSGWSPGSDLSPSARQPRVSAAELAYIESDPADPAEKIGWFSLLGYRETWAYALGKFLIDPIWWLFLFWTPDFLAKTYHLDLKSFGPPLIVIYLISDLGSVPAAGRHRR
jgi:hypothetical protein